MARPMTVTERAVREERAVVFGGMKELMEKFHETGSMTVEERLDYDRREERLKELDKDLKRISDFVKIEGAKDDDAETRGVSRDERDSREATHDRAFGRYLRHGLSGLSNDERRSLIERRVELRATDDANAIYTDAGASQAGFLVPQGFWHNLQIALKQFGGLLNVGRVIETSTGNPMPWPTHDPTNIIGNYVGNQGTQLSFQDYVFGQGMMHAWTITSNVALASLEAMNDSAFNVEEFVRDRIGESIGRFVAQQLQVGTGSNALLGIQTAIAAFGTNTQSLGGGGSLQSGGLYQAKAGGVVDTIGAFASPPTQNQLAAGSPNWLDIQNMIACVDPAYRASGRATWVMSDQALWKVRQIADGFGHPLWNPNVQVGGMDNIHGYPVLIDQQTGSISTVASTPGGIMFGDFATAQVIRQVNQAGVMRLDERYADFLQVGFLGFVRMDARSNDLRAAVLYKSPAS